MLRNKAFSTLQKTYDDSYLSCSTAVYYENQGDESEATRHWRNALHHIHEHHITKTVSGPGLMTDTEKALVNAIKELELQCKERIDLLEALRVSRHDVTASTSIDNLCQAPAVNESLGPAQGSIGQGTIPAIAWSDLSHPPLHSLSTPTSSENTAVGGCHPSIDPPLSTSHTTSRSHSPKTLTSLDKSNSLSSLDSHTMRTTLRSGGKRDKFAKPTRKSPMSAVEGSGKAATVAWSALVPRERLREANFSNGGSPKLESPSNSLPSSSTPRHFDECPHPTPSLSTTAASTALNCSSNNESLPPYKSSGKMEQGCSASRGAHLTKQTPRPSKSEQMNGSESNENLGGASRKKGTAGVPARRKAVSRRPAQEMQSGDTARDHERASRGRSERQRSRKMSTTSSSEDESGKISNVKHLAEPNQVAGRVNPYTASVVETAGEANSSDTIYRSPMAFVLQNLPPGVDEAAARQILNDVIIEGDEVRWGDIAGLEAAKNALRETVVYPFLRPDLFMGLREPARGMLLFGPPGTGKTMLARAVATESKSTFFSISASSLTSKYLGESEKLVKALFGLAKALAPSIIFVDEIDSLLSQRSGSGEHEASRRIKTEFLIQWSDLQRAAAGRATNERDKERGDANRVLVLAATNLPWAIDEAARRRFVRRQYIPLPEAQTRETQLRTLLTQQKHELSSDDISNLVNLTEGFSGSDITALAKDAAMGPLRSLGDALLQMTMDEIRPIMLLDFQSSLKTIRPSVSKAGLKEHEDWARMFGERGG